MSKRGYINRVPLHAFVRSIFDRKNIPYVGGCQRQEVELYITGPTVKFIETYYIW